ncbi:MAG TPA: hypothetical protein VE197_14180, partial [Mycobacterium sp.]|nr:hypothetical protein [Mycobacterium sp.]
MTTTVSGPAVEEQPRRLSPRQRAKRIRMVQYTLMVALVVVAIVFADWPTIGDAFFRFSLIKRTVTQGFGHALLNTAVYAAGGFILGLVVGTVL